MKSELTANLTKDQAAQFEAGLDELADFIDTRNASMDRVTPRGTIILSSDDPWNEAPRTDARCHLVLG